MYVCMYVCMYSGMYVCMYDGKYVYMYVCTFVYVWMDMDGLMDRRERKVEKNGGMGV